MKGRIGPALLVGVLALAAAPAGRAATAWEDPDAIPGRLLVKFRAEAGARLLRDPSAVAVPGLALQSIEAATRSAVTRLRPGQEFRALLPGTFVGTFDPAERDRVVAALESDPAVVYVEPDRVRRVGLLWGTATPNDPQLPLWGMTRIGAPEAWRVQSATRSFIRVAISESMFQTSHPDLAGQLSPAQNGMAGSALLQDHATHVAGTVAATGHNSQMVAGVANVELVSLWSGNSSSSFANGISWAASNSVDVINMSWKWCGDDGMNNGNDCDKCLYVAPSLTEQDAITSASNQILFVAAATNDACSTDGSGRAPTPVSYANVLGVSAIDDGDALANFSNFGSYVDLAAPGVGIVSTTDGGGTGSKDGTSMAAPHVAGSAAVLLALRQFYDPQSLDRLLRLTAEDLGAAGRDDSFGDGLVRADRASAAVADVYAEMDAAGPSYLGTAHQPHVTLGTAITAVSTGGRIGLITGPDFTGVTSITKACTIKAVGGTVTVRP